MAKGEKEQTEKEKKPTKKETKVSIWTQKENLILIEGWARDGLTDDEIAAKMDMTTRYLRMLKKENELINRVLMSGKEVADYAVERSLYQKALAGDTTAQIFWLKNRLPHKWRDVKKQSINIENANVIDLTMLVQSVDEKEKPEEIPTEYTILPTGNEED
jgi:ribosomal protein L25 (general stress protein Ctc)